MRILLVLTILFNSGLAVGQVTRDFAEDSSAEANASAFANEWYQGFQFRYNNDLFAGTDRYFTQGVHLELAHTALNFLNVGKLLTATKSGQLVTEVGLHGEAYSPSTILSDSILQVDRAYAGLAYLSLRGTALADKQPVMIESVLTIGVIGPAAQAAAIQTGIHRAIGNTLPLGWQHQIRNDLVLNYGLRVQYSKGTKPFRYSGTAQVDVGTLYNKATVGIGFATRPLYSFRLPFTLLLEGRTNGTYVGYNGTLQAAYSIEHRPIPSPVTTFHEWYFA